MASGGSGRGDFRGCGASAVPAAACPAPAVYRAEVPSYRAATAAVGMGGHCREDWVCRDPVSPQEAAAWAADWAGAGAADLWVLAAGSAVAVAADDVAAAVGASSS